MKKPMAMVRQRATSPAEPGCWAMFEKDRPKERQGEKAQGCSENVEVASHLNLS